MAISFKGSQSFVLRDGWAQKALIEMKNRPGVNVFSKKNGVVYLGIGSNMVISVKYWLDAAGILSPLKKAAPCLSEFGETIAKRDPYFELPVTWCLIHSNIVANKEMAPLFHLLFNELDINEGFTKDSFIESAEAFLSEEGVDLKKANYLEDDFSVLVRSYLPTEKKDPEDNQDCVLTGFGLIKRIAKGKYRKTMADLSLVHPKVVYYLLKQSIGQKTSASVEELFELPGGPCRLFNIDRSSFVGILMNLDNYGLVKMVRSAGLNTVYFHSEPYDLNRLYDELGGNAQ